MSDAEDRTQAPSERRLLRAREEGQAALSRELVTLSGLGAAALVLSIGMPTIADTLFRRLEGMLVLPRASPEGALGAAALAWASGAGPLLIAVAIAGVIGVVLQTGFLVHAKALIPDISRVSPGRGLKRVFGGTNAAEAAKSVAKLAVLGWAAYSSLRALWPSLGGATVWTPATLIKHIGREFVSLLLLIVAAQAVIALLDVGWTRWRFAQRLRMSRTDLKDEARESDGDPKVKSRLRQLRLARVRRQMVQAVENATVVVTNPTHYAVALAYERGAQSAPRVVAKGVDEMAARIRAVAERSGVPVVANPPLARSLYLVNVDSEVPTEHFRTVAEIIAYVWRLKGKAPVPQLKP